MLKASPFLERGRKGIKGTEMVKCPFGPLLDPLVPFTPPLVPLPA